MLQRIKQSFVVALMMAIETVVALEVLVVFYEVADWLNVDFFLVLSFPMRILGKATLMYWIIFLAVGAIDEAKNQETDPKASAKGTFCIYIIIFIAYTMLLCNSGYMKVSFAKTIVPMIVIAFIGSFVIWLIATDLKSKEQD